LAWVHEHIFAAGGEQIPSTWDKFSSHLDIQAVIHLSNPGPMSFRGPLPSRFLWLDIEDEQDADYRTQALCGKFVKDALASGENVLLHSTHGRHRTRWIYVAYLICTGRQVRSALRMAEEKPWQAPYHTDRAKWSDFKNFLRELPEFD
jgi:hypothetical protein